MATWKDATSGNWSDAGRWEGGVPDAVGATASFTRLFALFEETRVIEVGSERTVGTLNLVSSAIERYALRNGTIEMEAVPGSEARINVSGSEADARASTIDADVRLTSNTVISTTSASLSVFGNISGTGRLTKSGAGFLSFQGDNSWSGGTSITGGTISLGFSSGLGFSSLGTGAVSISAGGTLDLFGQFTDESLTINGLSGAGTITNSGRHQVALVQFNSGNKFFSGVITDAEGRVAFTKTGTGTLELSGANSYSGPTLLQAGTISAGAFNTWSANSAIEMRAGTTLDLDGFSQRIGALSGAGLITNTTGLSVALRTTSTGDTTFSGTISDGAGTLGLTKSGAGTLTLSGANTYEGATTVLSGTLKGGVDNAFGEGSRITVSAGAALDLGAFNHAIGALSGAGSVRATALGPQILTLTDATSSTFSGVISDGSAFAGTLALTKDAVGTLTLSGANTYHGPTTVNAGVLRAGATNALSADSAIFVKAGAVLDLNGFSQSIGALSGDGSVRSSDERSVALTQRNAAASTFSGVISDGDGMLRLIKTGAGALQLADVNTYTGSTTVNAGTLALTGAGSIAQSASLVINTGAVFDISGVTGTAAIKTLTNRGSVELGGETLLVTAQQANPIGTYLASAESDRIVFNMGPRVSDLSLTSATLTGWTDGSDVLAVIGNSLTNTITGSGFADTLSGAGGNDTIIGNSGADVLNGGSGVDTLRGGAGNDTYVLGGEATGADEIEELSGIDVITSTVSRSLADSAFNGIENVILLGTGNIDATGDEGANTLTGNSGANRLDGGLGADQMSGGAGSDTYVMDDVGDRVVVDASGVDTVESSVTFSLSGTTVENLFLTGTGNISATGNDLANSMTGNLLGNTISGGGGADRLTGGGGRDVLSGGADADTFDYNAVAETVDSNLRDLILDWEPGVDKIDLSTIDADIDAADGDQAFNFIGTAAFSGADGELRVSFVDLANNASDRTLITGDVNGATNGGRFQIAIVGLHTLQGGIDGDFIL